MLSRPRKLLPIALCAFSVLTLAASLADARVEVVNRRTERVKRAETRWEEPQKVMINVHYRVPVIEALGYLAATNDDNTRLVEIANRLRPIAKRVNELSGESFHGRQFPPEVRNECDQMHTALFSDIEKVYGKHTVEKVQAYLDNKYSLLTDGLFSPIQK